MTYRIVTMVDGQMIAQEPKDITEWAAVCGIEITGVHSSPNTRDCLQGQVKLNGFLGPMYDGTDKDGNPVIRYEDAESYDRLSA